MSIEARYKKLTPSEKEADFLKCYYETFKQLTGISKDKLMEYYREDTYSGYPYTPGGSAWESELRALYCLIRILKPQKVLEIGNYIGTSANHILLAVERNQTGEVHLLDILEQIDQSNIHNKKYVRHIQDSLKYLDQPLDFDLIVQDGCHTYDHVKIELDKLCQNSNQDFYIWAHDYYAPENNVVQVRRAWDAKKHLFNNFCPLKDSHSNCGFVVATYKK